ncbi:MAG: hypothetical protein AAF483_10050 [Planctomycetota bacterium]
MATLIDEVTAKYRGNLSKPFIEFARRQLVNATMFEPSERRNEDRHPMMLPVLIVPINESNDPVGPVAEAITRDVASTSIGLFHEDPMEHTRLAVRMDLANVEVNLALKIIWASDMGPFFGSAGWYTRKLNEFPADISQFVDSFPRANLD